jgi:hypothetical protein
LNFNALLLATLLVISDSEGFSSNIPAKKYKSLSAVLGVIIFSVKDDSTSK